MHVNKKERPVGNVDDGVVGTRIINIAGASTSSNTSTRTSIITARPSKSSTCSRQQTTKTSLWKDLLAGGVAGTAGIAIGHPFDTIKVRLQQQQPPNTKIPIAALRGTTTNIVNSAAANPSYYRGLYRGIGAPLATAALVNASIFCVYGATSRLWDNHYPIITTNTTTTTTTTDITKNAVCGGITGLITSLLLCPVEHVKIRLQTTQLSNLTLNSNSSSSSSLQVAKQILNSEHGGVRGLYRGFSATILRQALSFSVYFPVYNIMKNAIGSSYNNTNNSNNNNNNTDSPWWSSALAGGLAGCLSWTIVYPIDVIKSRIQSLPMDHYATTPARERSFYFMARNIARNEGFASLIFSRGLAVTILRAFPVNGTIFFVYEYVNQRLQFFNDDNNKNNNIDENVTTIGNNSYNLEQQTQKAIQTQKSHDGDSLFEWTAISMASACEMAPLQERARNDTELVS